MISDKLKKQQDIWERREADISEQGKAIMELGKIEKEIKALKPKWAPNRNQVLIFDPDQIFSAIIDLMQVGN